MNFTYHLDSVRMLVLELGPEYLVEMVLPREQVLYHDRLRQFMESSHGLLQSRVVELTPEFRVVVPERMDGGDLITIQALLRDTAADDIRESWQVAIQGPSDLMSDICQRLRDRDKPTNDAIMCHALGEQMDHWSRCDQCEDRDPLLGGCKAVHGSFHSACSNCIYRGCQMSCTLRDYEEYRPSNKGRASARGKRGIQKSRARSKERSKKRRLTR